MPLSESCKYILISMKNVGILFSAEFGESHIAMTLLNCSLFRSCMEHALYLRVGHVLAHINPPHTRKGATNIDPDDGPDSDNEGVNHGDNTVADALRKVLGLVRQVCVSYQWNATSTNLFLRYGNHPKHESSSNEHVWRLRYQNWNLYCLYERDGHRCSTFLTESSPSGRL
jgi:hypothetical protein